jgi:hypothetical protein
VHVVRGTHFGESTAKLLEGLGDADPARAPRGFVGTLPAREPTAIAMKSYRTILGHHAAYRPLPGQHLSETGGPTSHRDEREPPARKAA